MYLWSVPVSCPPPDSPLGPAELQDQGIESGVGVGVGVGGEVLQKSSGAVSCLLWVDTDLVPVVADLWPWSVEDLFLRSQLL